MTETTETLDPQSAGAETPAAPPRWKALAAEREAVALLLGQCHMLRRRLTMVVDEARKRLAIPESQAIDIHLPTGLWFRVGDPVPTGDRPPADQEQPRTP